MKNERYSQVLFIQKKFSTIINDERYGEGCKATTINIILLLKYDV